MFGDKPRITPLESRKRLLVAESELNRAQLAQEWGALTVGVITLTGRIKSFSSIASTAALLVAGLAAFRRGKCLDAEEIPFWLQAIRKGTSLVATLWLAFRSRAGERVDK